MTKPEQTKKGKADQQRAIETVHASFVSNGWIPLLLGSRFALPRGRAMVTKIHFVNNERVLVRIESNFFEGWLKTNPIVALGTIAHLTEFLVEGFECESDGEEMELDESEPKPDVEMFAD